MEKRYAESGLVLCLGAGVSRDSGIPSWTELLYRLGVLTMPKSDGDAMVRSLVQSGLTLPAVASVIEAKWKEEHPKSEKEEFAELVRQALYRDLPVRDSSDMADLVAVIKRKNHTLQAIAAFCTVRRDDQSYGPNPRIRAIVNLNYDALLRSYMNFRYNTRLLRTIERPDASPRPDRIPVYHPHGFLHFNPKHWGDLDSETPDQLVLTEQEYFDFFSKPLSLFTYTMLFLLREHRFLFVGTGLKDDNVRRLLHYSKQERLAGFKRRGRKKALSRTNRHFAILPHEQSAQLEELVDASLKRLGVRTIWTEKHEEIPRILQRVYEFSGDNKWADVY